MKILEVNNIDLPGKRFNGYDILNYINNNTKHSAYQIVCDKLSNSDFVIPFLDINSSKIVKNMCDELQKELSIQMMISPLAYKLMNYDIFKKADIVHYHLIHNNIFSLNSLKNLFNNKPSIWTIHDPWITTGHCIYPRKCEYNKTGCKNCPHLDYIFPMKEDNSNSMWKIKKEVFSTLDVDIIVASNYMKKLIETSPLTSCFKKIHLIPFGIENDIFKPQKNNLRKKFQIGQDEIVLFFRAQDTGVKGIENIREALNLLKTDKKVIILTCDTKGLMKSLEKKYKIIDYGWINDEKELVLLYNTCDIFLMPSTAEAFGVMAIEAMSCEKPVIVFDGTSLPEVTFSPKCGLNVEMGNSEQLSQAIKFLIENPNERIIRGKLGRRLALKYYNIEDYNKKIVSLYENIYKNKKVKSNLKNSKYNGRVYE